MTTRIFFKLIACVVCLLLLALVSIDYFTTRVAGEAYIHTLVDQLAAKSRLLALQIDDAAHVDQARVKIMAAAAGGRVTVVRNDGVVTADSEADPAKMENHRNRPELIQAFSGQTGFNVRRSVTLGVPYLYVAEPIPSGAVRVAVPMAVIDGQVKQLRGRILISTALAFLPAVFLAGLLARWISHRFASIMSHAQELAHGNFRARLARPGSSEFGELGRTLNETAENLQTTVEQLQREHVELEKLERIRKDFVINVSHELRTPLASIQGYTETLIDGALHDPDHNMKFLGIIRHNAERLARLTEDLLTLSRIEQKRQKLEFEPYSVNGLLAQAVEQVRPIAEKSDIRLEAERIPQDAEAWCDCEAVSQVLSNLMDNAIKYTPAGGCISVGARPAGRFVEMWVRDTGVGIPAEDLPRLFERFYRVDKARSRELGGTGLGLSIVKHLVASHNGTVRVESLPNEGSTFFFTLPLEESALPEIQLNPEFTAS